jgi:RNA polymerase sigma factor (sigma-70 family)
MYGWMMNDDMELVRQYVDHNSEDAFAALVARHIDLVYSVALRRVREPQLAEDVTQAVFVILAGKAHSFSSNTIIPGWLCRTARYASANALAIQRRRQHREQEAYMQSREEESASEVWTQIAPHLDDALASLNEKSHNAVVLRYFEGKSFQEIGAGFGVSENAAKKRVGHALEQLRKYFSKRGVVVPLALLMSAISANSVQAAPAALAKTISAVALAKGTAAGTSTFTLIKGALKLMAWSKAKSIVIAGVVVLFATTTAVVTFPKIRYAYLEHKVEWVLDWQKLKYQPPVTLIRPTQLPEYDGGGYMGGVDPTMGNMIGLKQSVPEIMLLAYRNPNSPGDHLHRIAVSTDLPRGEYDFIASTLGTQHQALQQALKKKFGLIAHWETRDMAVLLLKMKYPNAPGLQVTAIARGFGQGDKGKYSIKGGSISQLAGYLEDDLLDRPVIDQTGLTNTYDIELTWDSPGRDWNNPTRPVLDRILLDQLGLELVPTNMPLEVLVIAKAK